MTVGDLKKYKDELYKSLSRNLTSFEKNFLLVSAGVLTFSITFIKEIVKIEDAILLILLFIGWGLIVIAVALLMITFLISANSSNKLWKCVDDYLLKNNKFNNDEELTNDEAQKIKVDTNQILFNFKTKLKHLRLWAVIAFLIGLTSFSTFVAINLSHENDKAKTAEVVKFSNKDIIIKIDSIEIVNNKISK